MYGTAVIIILLKAFSRIKGNLNNINIFHTDRGNEFKNKLIDEVLEASENYYKTITEKFFKLNKENKDFLNKAYLTNESI